MISLNDVINNILLLTGNSKEQNYLTGTLVSFSNHFRDISKDLTENVKAINSYKFKELQIQKEQILDLFYKILPSYPYDRCAITHAGDLEKILDPELADSHDTKEFCAVSEKKIMETVLEAQFSIKLGIKLEKAPSSYHKVYYVLDRFQNRLGVLKPAEKIPEFMDLYGASEIRESHLAEVANSAIDQICGFEVVPHTVLFKYCLPSDTTQTTGSFQFYVNNASYLLDHLKDGGNLWDSNYQKLQDRLNINIIKDIVLINFEEFALFDMLTANNDRHFKNTFYKDKKLIAIDNGNSFPWCHDLDLPIHKKKPLHWFRWRVLPHAQNPFSDETVKKIEGLDTKKIEDCMRKTLVDASVPSSRSTIKGKVQCFHDRVAKIQTLTKKNTPMALIAIAILKLKDFTDSQVDSLESDKK